MKKNLLIAAIAITALASCSSDEFVGEQSPQVTNGNGAISFGSGLKAVTRANFTGNDAATKLNSEMKVYGVKQNRTTSTNYDLVFPSYSVKYSTTYAGHDEYNQGWYYVGAGANGSQTIKYWDWASANYHFAAGSPVANFTFAPNGTTGDIETATVTGLGGRLNHSTSVGSDAAAVYIADPKIVAKANYNSEVEFTFRSMQTKVRVGIYETIPGYKITGITFYNNDATPVPSNYITLNSATTGYFQGGTSVTGTITYNWSTPTYTLTYGAGLTSGKYWEGGQFNGTGEYAGIKGVPATSSTDATNLYGTESNKASDGYFIVMPTPSATSAAPLTLTCDYTLKSLDTDETIEVSGATATIPADYTKWVANTAYTYLFKISDNTNGKTDPSQPNSGLYPITFDAVVVNVADQQTGTETTVSTPSITVYQNGDVVDNGITYVAGSVTVHAYEGATDVTSTATWSYVELASFDYSSDYEHLGAAGAATSWTSGKLTTVAASKTYVIKAVTSNGTAYFVLVVSAAESGPANS
jgi:hypothetical protein